MSFTSVSTGLMALLLTLVALPAHAGKKKSSPAPTLSAEFPFESKYVDVLGSKMHYVEEGEGDPILLIHGNPASSYLWRNVIPHISGQGRVIAVDLIGMGMSDHPDIDYRYDDHYRYLEAFVDELGIDQNLTLVIHDWGSGLGFRYAHQHPDDIKGIAFMEGLIGPMTWKTFPKEFRTPIRMFRTPGLGNFMSGPANLFVNMMLPKATHGELSDEAHDYYKALYPTVKSRRPLGQWPREIPINGKPADNHETMSAYHEWLQVTPVPKLLIHADPGSIITPVELAWCRENLSNLETVDLGEGIHFFQETYPDEIGAALSEWHASLEPPVSDPGPSEKPPAP